MIRKQVYLLLFIFSSPTIAQNTISDARTTIETLTSAEFSGRGYTENGMEKAAKFLADGFYKIGLKPLNDSYYLQEFSTPINVIHNAELKLNGRQLKYGVDFIVKPNSKSQNFHSKENYLFSPQDFETSIQLKSTFIDFIKKDTEAQLQKHIVFPPYIFKLDSINQYYKSWANFYKPHENRNRAIFYFSNDKLISSLSQVQDSSSTFFIDSKLYKDNLKIDDYKIESQFIPNFKVQNIIGKIDGENPDSIIVITAHYDHLGKVGNVHFPGASDNASGVAFLLELSKYFSQTKPKYTLLFICFAAEEVGLLGSTYFVEKPIVDLKKIKFLLNFDIMGAGEEGIQIVNGSIFTKEFEQLNQINTKHNYIKQIKKRGEACNSDHCPFYQKGIPSFFIYTLGGPGYYHDIHDSAETLSLSKFYDLQKLFIAFIQNL